MIDQNLIDYIKKSKEQGFSDEEIKKTLLDTGWGEEDINEGFKVLEAVPESPPLPVELSKTQETFQPEREIKKTKSPITLISIIFLIAGIGHFVSIPIYLLFGLVGWAFVAMAIFSVICAALLFVCSVALRKMKTWYLKPFLMLFGLVIVVGLALFFAKWDFTYLIEILILAIIFWVLWRQKEKFGYQSPVQFFKRWSFLLLGIIIGLIIGGVILAEAYGWITPKYEEIEEEIGKEKEEIVEVISERWAIYTNAEYGYQIDYPADWALYDQPYVRFQTFSGEDCVIQEDCLSIAIEVKSKFSSLEEWINKWKDDISKATEQGLNWEVEEGEILVGGRKGYEFITWLPGSSIVPAGHRIGVFEKEKLYYIRAEGLKLTLLEKYPKTFERMISSFKFID